MYESDRVGEWVGLLVVHGLNLTMLFSNVKENTYIQNQFQWNWGTASTCGMFLLLLWDVFVFPCPSKWDFLGEAFGKLFGGRFFLMEWTF